ncbi:MAG: M23 family metallopeptidase [Chloroflexota bacterium]
MFRFNHWLRLLLIVCGIVLLMPGSYQPTAAQDQCGTLDVINYPIDQNTFQLAQNYGTASPRHQGRYHTGEDWFAGYGATRGQPVRAVGRGLVTLSSPTAWGVDGGVVIIRHTLEDGSFVYSQYGHIEQTETVRFPARLSCVEAGEVIGVIGDARPAPHLHFEMRVYTAQNPAIADTPGPGYTRTPPDMLGWRRPAHLVTNLQARLSRAFLWETALATYRRPTPPLLLNDNSLLVVDGDRLRRVTNDGRIMWRVTLPARAVNLHGLAAQSFVTLADGDVLQVNVENGALTFAYALDFQPTAPPLDITNGRLYPTSTGTLNAVSVDQRETYWQADAAPTFEHGIATDSLVVLASQEAVTFYSADGLLLDTAELEAGAALAATPEGDAILYTRGGLWRVDSTGEWSLLLSDIPPGGSNSAVLMMADGRIYLTDGSVIYAYNPDGSAAWQARLPQQLEGRIHLQNWDGILFIIATHGRFVALRDSGGVCGFGAMYGDEDATLWYDRGPDNVLRISLGDRIMGFGWERLTNAC